MKLTTRQAETLELIRDALADLAKFSDHPTISASYFDGRTMAALARKGLVTIDSSGFVSLLEPAQK